MRSALLSTICRCTHEWSLMPRRSAVTCAACQRALSCVSALAAASTPASLGLRSLGAWMRIAATASRGVAISVGVSLTAVMIVQAVLRCVQARL